MFLQQFKTLLENPSGVFYVRLQMSFFSNRHRRDLSFFFLHAIQHGSTTTLTQPTTQRRHTASNTNTHKHTQHRHITLPLSTSPSPAPVQDHFIPSGTRLAQEYLDKCFCMLRATRQPTIKLRPTHSGTQVKSEPCVQKEPTGREGKRDEQREREREMSREALHSQQSRCRAWTFSWHLCFGGSPLGSSSCASFSSDSDLPRPGLPPQGGCHLAEVLGPRANFRCSWLQHDGPLFGQSTARRGAGGGPL